MTSNDLLAALAAMLAIGAWLLAFTLLAPPSNGGHAKTERAAVERTR